VVRNTKVMRLGLAASVIGAATAAPRFLEPANSSAESLTGDITDNVSTTLSPEGQYWKHFGEEMGQYWKKFGEQEDKAANRSQGNDTRTAWAQFGETQSALWEGNSSDAASSSESRVPVNFRAAQTASTPSGLTVIDGISIDDIGDDSDNSTAAEGSDRQPGGQYWSGFGQGTGSWKPFDKNDKEIDNNTIAQYSNATAWQQYGQKLGKSWSEFGEKAAPEQGSDAGDSDWKKFGEGVASAWEGKNSSSAGPDVPASLLTIDGIKIDDIGADDGPSSTPFTPADTSSESGQSTTLSPEAAYWKNYGKDVAGYWHEFGQQQNDTFREENSNATRAAWQSYGETLGAGWSQFGESQATKFLPGSLSQSEMSDKIRELEEDFQQSVNGAIQTSSLSELPDVDNNPAARLSDAVRIFWSSFSVAEDKYWQQWKGLSAQFWGSKPSVA